jgi:hypothetical protein
MEQCAGLGVGNAIPLDTIDEEPLFVTLEHNGFFDAQVTTHDSEPETLFLSTGERNYYRSSCSYHRLSGSGILSFVVRGTRDFKVVAIPSFPGDDRPTKIQIIDHYVDYSGESNGRILDMLFMRAPDLSNWRP